MAVLNWAGGRHDITVGRGDKVESKSAKQASGIDAAAFQRSTDAARNKMLDKVKRTKDGGTCSTCGYRYSGSKCDNPGCEASGNVPKEILERRKREAGEAAEREKIARIRSQYR